MPLHHGAVAIEPLAHGWLVLVFHQAGLDTVNSPAMLVLQKA